MPTVINSSLDIKIVCAAFDLEAWHLDQPSSENAAVNCMRGLVGGETTHLRLGIRQSGTW